jgi:hypothetical protein
MFRYDTSPKTLLAITTGFLVWRDLQMLVEVIEWFEPVIKSVVVQNHDMDDKTYFADLLNSTHLWNHHGRALVVW